MLTAEWGGTGGKPIESGMVVEEPDIEIGAGVSSKGSEPPGMHSFTRRLIIRQPSADACLRTSRVTKALAQRITDKAMTLAHAIVNLSDSKIGTTTSLALHLLCQALASSFL